jgi:amino acid efflux transporter
MIYLLCMLAGCRLLRALSALAAFGSLLCLLLLAMGLEEPVRDYDAGGAVAVFTEAQAGGGVFQAGVTGPGKHVNRGDRLYDPDGRAVIFTLVFPFKGIAAARSGAKAAARHPAKAQMRHQLHGQVLLHRRQQQQQAEESVKNPGRSSSRPAIISDTLLIISAAGLSLPPSSAASAGSF